MYFYFTFYVYTDYMYLVRGHNVLYNTADVSHVEQQFVLDFIYAASTHETYFNLLK